ncbi:MAG: class I SAM-dependent methyltransferase [Prevotellaceae bacterium]|nr:class I SAM-dependent methyltransferase [Prevotellaceae bacterium]
MPQPLDKSPARIAAMFDHIAPHYDFLNHFLSLNMDKRWRKKLVRKVAQRQPATILDVATGTGDLAIMLLRQTRAAITAVDISEGMLEIARRKTTPPQPSPSGRETSPPTPLQRRGETAPPPLEGDGGRCLPINWLPASAEALPFPAGAFDAVTVAFGVRNFENLDKGLQEMYRVLKPGGFAAILEFASPARFPVKPLFRFYFHFALPLIGRLFSGHRTAYRYLPASVNRFPQRNEFLQLLQQAGFKDAHCQSLSCGIAMLYSGTRAKKS